MSSASRHSQCDSDDDATIARGKEGRMRCACWVAVNVTVDVLIMKQNKKKAGIRVSGVDAFALVPRPSRHGHRHARTLFFLVYVRYLKLKMCPF